MGLLGDRASAFVPPQGASEKKIRKIIDKKQILPMSLLEYVAPGNIKAAAVHVQPRRYQKLGEYIDDMEAHIFSSLQKTCHVVCFPELTGLLPLSLLQQGRPDDDLLQAALSTEPGQYTDREIERFKRQLNSCAGFMLECFYTTFSMLARRYAAYICAGGPYVRENGGFYNRAYLFSPRGEPDLIQDKLHPSAFERRIGIKGGGSVNVKKTIIGNVAIALGGDGAYFEHFKIARAMGADLAFTSSGPWERLSGASDICAAQFRARESGLYTVCSAIGEGKTGIFTVCERTRDGSGTAAQSESLSGSEPVVARLSGGEPVKADAYRNDKNPACYANLLRAAGFKPLRAADEEQAETMRTVLETAAGAEPEDMPAPEEWSLL